MLTKANIFTEQTEENFNELHETLTGKFSKDKNQTTTEFERKLQEKDIENGQLNNQIEQLKFVVSGLEF